MRAKVVLIAALIFSAYACSPRGGAVSIVEVNGNKMFVASLRGLSSNIVTIPLSSLVESMELVQLEDHDDAFFRSHFTTVTANYIGVRQQDLRPYLLFSRRGQFLGNIGSVGQGPGEYQWLYDDIIDDKNKLIYLVSTFGSNRVLVYNTSGAFVREIVTPVRLSKPKIFLSDNILTVLHKSFSEDSPMGFQIDINTNQVVREVSTPAHLVMFGYDSEIFNTRNVPGVFDFFYPNNDTLFHFDARNNRLIPFFTMTSYEHLQNRYLQINNDLILTEVFTFENNRFALRGTVATDLRNLTSSYVNIVNDFFGNLPVRASVATFRNGYFVYNVQPEDLMDAIENRLAESNVTENDRQQLQQLLSKLEEDTNNVVFIGRLRSGIETRLF